MPNVTDEVTAIKQLPPERKSTLIVFLLLLFIVGVVGGAVFIRLKPAQIGVYQPKVVVPTTANATKANLAIKPASKTLAVGEVLPISVELTGAGVQATDIILKFDPEVFSAGAVTPGTILPEVLQQKVEPGKVAVSLSVKPTNPAASATGTVFTIMLTALKASPSAAVSFDPTDTIAAKAGDNILGTATGGKYTIQ